MPKVKLLEIKRDPERAQPRLYRRALGKPRSDKTFNS